MNIGFTHPENSYRADRFRGFIRSLSAAVETATDEEALLAHCSHALGQLVAHDDWLPEQFRQPAVDRYQQFLLYCDPQERFSVVSFVWGPGQSTPIHDHRTWGVIGILSGAETSQRFRLSDGVLVAEGPPHNLQRGDVETLSPQTGDIHQVANGLPDEPSIAIHVYGADIGSMRRFTYAPDGAQTPFISRYAPSDLPNFWLADPI